MTREEWLNLAVDELRPLFEPEYKVPELKISIGFPAKGGLSKRRVLGVCWKAEVATDRKFQIYINPTIADVTGSDGVLSVVAHEMVHACGISGHGKEFAKCGLKIGLEGKMSSSVAGQDLQARFRVIEKKIGAFPHAPLVPTNSLSASQKPDKCRIHKCTCLECGYTVRVSAKWLDMAVPVCPVCDKEMQREMK